MNQVIIDSVIIIGAGMVLLGFALLVVPKIICVLAGLIGRDNATLHAFDMWAHRTGVVGLLCGFIAASAAKATAHLLGLS